MAQWLWSLDDQSRYGYYPYHFPRASFIATANHTITFEQSLTGSPLAVGIGLADLDRIELVIPPGHYGINLVIMGY